MRHSARAFKVGIFVIVMVMLFVVSLGFLSSGLMRDPMFLVETYIDESVQGLEIGAPVKLRGVGIGKVHAIDFVMHQYPEVTGAGARYVVVLMAVDPAAFEVETASDLTARLTAAVERGLRVRLRSQGLTGLSYLEVDFHDAEEPPELSIAWRPRHPYVPYVPSLSAQLNESLQSVNAILDELRRSHFAETLRELGQLVATTQSTLDGADVGKLLTEATAFIGELRRTNSQLQKTVAGLDLSELIGDIRRTSETLRLALEAVDLGGLQGEVHDLLAEVQASNERLQQILANQAIDETIDNLAASSGSLKRIVTGSEEGIGETLASVNTAARRLTLTATRLDRMVTGEQDGVATISGNLRAITENLRELTGYLRKYPAQALFGEPPPAVRPTHAK